MFWIAAAELAWVGGALFLLEGTDEGLPVVLRGTARVSFVLFNASFVAAGLRGLWPESAAVRWLGDHAGYLFVACGASHLMHLGTIFAAGTVGVPPEGSQLLGALTYLSIVGVALGYAWRRGREPAAARWRVAQEIALHWVWLSFAAAYLAKTLEHPPFAAALVVTLFVLILRVFRFWPRCRGG